MTLICPDSTHNLKLFRFGGHKDPENQQEAHGIPTGEPCGNHGSGSVGLGGILEPVLPNGSQVLQCNR